MSPSFPPRSLRRMYPVTVVPLGETVDNVPKPFYDHGCLKGDTNATSATIGSILPFALAGVGNYGEPY